MRSTALILVGLALALAGCKKPKPSPEYEEASALHSRLYTEHLEDAYLQPEMDRVEELLKAVPADSLDAKAAGELLAKVRTERKRVQEEEEARQKETQDALQAPEAPPDEPPSPATVEAPAAADAGAEESQPVPGMTADVFRSKFSGCFQVGPQVKVVGEGWADTWELKNIANCRDRHPDYLNSVVAIKDGKVHARFLKSEIRQVVQMPDGGEVLQGR